MGGEGVGGWYKKKINNFGQENTLFKAMPVYLGLH